MKSKIDIIKVSSIYSVWALLFCWSYKQLIGMRQENVWKTDDWYTSHFCWNHRHYSCMEILEDETDTRNKAKCAVPFFWCLFPWPYNLFGKVVLYYFVCCSIHYWFNLSDFSLMLIFIWKGWFAIENILFWILSGVIVLVMIVFLSSVEMGKKE